MSVADSIFCVKFNASFLSKPIISLIMKIILTHLQSCCIYENKHLLIHPLKYYEQTKRQGNNHTQASSVATLCDKQKSSDYGNCK